LLLAAELGLERVAKCVRRVASRCASLRALSLTTRCSPLRRLFSALSRSTVALPGRALSFVCSSIVCSFLLFVLSFVCSFFCLLSRFNRASSSLLVHGANVDARDSNGATALHYAMEEEDLELMRVFLRAGANVRLGNKDWSETNNALCWAAGRGALRARSCSRAAISSRAAVSVAMALCYVTSVSGILLARAVPYF